MTKFILHGGYTREENDLNKGFFTELVNDVSQNGQVLFIYFASDNEKGIDDKFKQEETRVREIAGNKEFNIKLATRGHFIDEIKESDAVYIRGGDTKRLEETLRKYPEFENAIKGKTVAGSSAGAYVLSTYYFTNSQNKVLEGFGLLPLRVVCHYESTLHPAPENVDPAVAMEAYDNSLELVLLKDYEWRVFEV